MDRSMGYDGGVETLIINLCVIMIIVTFLYLVSQGLTVQRLSNIADSNAITQALEDGLGHLIRWVFPY